MLLYPQGSQQLFAPGPSWDPFSATVLQIYSVYIIDNVIYCLGLVSHTGRIQPIPLHYVRNVGLVRQFVRDFQGMVPHFKIKIVVDMDFINF